RAPSLPAWAWLCRKRKIPTRDDARLVFVAESGNGGGAQSEKAAFLGRQAEPAGSQDAQDVAVGEERDIARGGQRAGDGSLGAFGHLDGGFAVGHAIGPQRPCRAFGLDLRGGAPFIIAVIPLAEVRVDEGVLVAGETAGFAGALEGGDQDERELAKSQVAAEGGGFVAAGRGEGNIGAAGVSARTAPLGFAMADQPEFAHQSDGSESGGGCPARCRRSYQNNAP